VSFSISHEELKPSAEMESDLSSISDDNKKQSKRMSLLFQSVPPSSRFYVRVDQFVSENGKRTTTPKYLVCSERVGQGGFGEALRRVK
jgi:hypothetical protein